MTVRERVLASRLIQKIDTQNMYAKELGVSYKLEASREKKGKGNKSKENH